MPRPSTEDDEPDPDADPFQTSHTWVSLEVMRKAFHFTRVGRCREEFHFTELSKTNDGSPGHRVTWVSSNLSHIEVN